jgi:N-methylhydantoinase A/oxoprolinase/acetone carboxylase beta subunit
VPDRAAGPCVIEQYDTTVVVDSGWHARSLADGNIVIERV